ncbi:MAG: hypothetical protein F2839_05875 [Actinobacteria bacterium]|uniref:Unannotated protein n=1 Tax=freshwater metagenome TaxID=449393 RepID=A0A6J5ZIZ9_9ZZZZ|nr:hypothetical protein [Actinomycetota bacterium]
MNSPHTLGNRVQLLLRRLSAVRIVASVVAISLLVVAAPANPALASNSCSTSIGIDGTALVKTLDVEQGATLTSTAATKAAVAKRAKLYKASVAKATRVCKVALNRARVAKNKKLKSANFAVTRVVARVMYDVAKTHRSALREGSVFSALQSRLASTQALLTTVDAKRGPKKYREARLAFRSYSQVASSRLGAELQTISSNYSSSRSIAIDIRRSELAQAGRDAVAISAAWDKYAVAINHAAAVASEQRKTAVRTFQLGVVSAHRDYEDDVDEIEDEETDDD